MAIVIALLGAMYCGTALAPIVTVHDMEIGQTPLYNVVFGGILVVCGLVMMPAFGLSEKRRNMDNLALVTASLTALLGLGAIILVYRNPFSWMTAIVSMALLIDAICLKINLKAQK